MKLFFSETPRAPHLYRIWNQLREQKSLPQVDRWLANIFRGEKRFGKKDRQWYADAVFAALRLGPFALAMELGEAATDFDWQALRGLDSERLFFWLSLEREANDRFPEDVARIEKIRQEQPLLAAGLPPVYTKNLERRQALSQWSGEDCTRFLRRQNEKAPLWLRVNHPAKAEAARRELTAAGLQWTEEGDAWRIDAGRSLQNLQCLEQGILEIQDFASQMIGAAAKLSGKPLIWDCCAGGGGKTMQLASRLQGRGLVFASDVRHYKLDEVKRRAERAGLQGVRVLAWDGEALRTRPREWTEAGGLDLILIDAPCSGTGTWRRSPDGKYRCTPAEILQLQKLQISIFEKVLPQLKPGGQLIYATCSWLPEENEDVVASALEQHPDLRLENQQLCGNPAADADTMFYAIFRKQS